MGLFFSATEKEHHPIKLVGNSSYATKYCSVTPRQKQLSNLNIAMSFWTLDFRKLHRQVPGMQVCSHLDFFNHVRLVSSANTDGRGVEPARFCTREVTGRLVNLV